MSTPKPKTVLELVFRAAQKILKEKGIKSSVGIKDSFSTDTFSGPSKYGYQVRFRVFEGCEWFAFPGMITINESRYTKGAILPDVASPDLDVDDLANRIARTSEIIHNYKRKVVWEANQALKEIEAAYGKKEGTAG